MTRAPITPNTKVGELLLDYPELEPVLIAMAPAFEKLKNPILRRTVARVATLAQAARVAGLEPRTLVVELRRHAGQEVGEPWPHPAERDAPASTEEPPWVSEVRIVERLDADALLASGSHPMAALGPRVAALGAGEALELVASFYPAPLVDALTARGNRVFSRPGAGGSTTTTIAGREVGTASP